MTTGLFPPPTKHMSTKGAAVIHVRRLASAIAATRAKSYRIAVETIADIDRYGGTRAEIAARLGIAPDTLRRRLRAAAKRHGLHPQVKP